MKFTTANFSEMQGFLFSPQYKPIAPITVHTNNLHFPSLDNPQSESVLELVYYLEKWILKNPLSQSHDTSGSHYWQINQLFPLRHVGWRARFWVVSCRLKSDNWKSFNFCLIATAGLNQENSSAEMALKDTLNLKQMLLVLILNQGLTVSLLNYRKD